jgi:hypothetical protein
MTQMYPWLYIQEVLCCAKLCCVYAFLCCDQLCCVCTVLHCTALRYAMMCCIVQRQVAQGAIVPGLRQVAWVILGLLVHSEEQFLFVNVFLL